MSKSTKSIIFLVFLILAAAAVGLMGYDKLHPTIDKNNDGKPDEFFVYNLKGELVSLEKDRNFDGRIDHVEKYRYGKIVSLAVDMNNNGIFEVKTNFDENGLQETMERDLDEDGKADRIVHYDPKTQVQEWYEEDTDHDGVMDKRTDNR
jgi:hypothetical protein